MFVKNNDEIQRIHQYHRDTCDWLSKDEIWFTVSAFEELGGVKDKVPEANSYIPNVKYVFSPRTKVVDLNCCIAGNTFDSRGVQRYTYHQDIQSSCVECNCA